MVLLHLTRGAALAALVLATACSSLPVVATEDFDRSSSLARFECTDTKAWRWLEVDGTGALDLHQQSAYVPPHRSPLNLALLRDVTVGDFELELEAWQTGREYPHRDLVFVFGYRDPAHFCYAHLASAADGSAHHLQVVDGADRAPRTVQRTQGVAWGSGWKHVRIERSGARVRVWFDRSPEPVLEGELPAWPGRIGLGSFDDTGRFTGLVLRGATAQSLPSR
ncbi:MAG: hypothetical protein RIT25_2503 [Planctomycetota bacterium]